MLFTKINMDTFGDVLAGAFADLDDLLGRAPVARGGNGEARKSDELLMQLTAMCMFVAWNISYVPPDHRPGCVTDLAVSLLVRLHSGGCSSGLHMQFPKFNSALHVHVCRRGEGSGTKTVLHCACGCPPAINHGFSMTMGDHKCPFYHCKLAF